jgi:hypothetical protein
MHDSNSTQSLELNFRAPLTEGDAGMLFHCVPVQPVR